MKDRKFHNKKLPGDYPVPEVSADDAWTAMNSLLDNDIHKPQHPPVKPGMPATSKIFLYLSLLTVVISVFVLIKQSWQNSQKVESSKIEKVIVKQLAPFQHDGSQKPGSEVNVKNIWDGNTANLLQKTQSENATNNTIHSESAILSSEDKMTTIKGINSQNNHLLNNITAKDTRKNISKKFSEKNNKNGQRSQLVADAPDHPYVAGSASAILTDGITKSNSPQENITFSNVQRAGARAGSQPIANDAVGKIEDMEGLEVTSLASSIAEILNSQVLVILDSSYFKKLKESSISSSKKGSKKLTGKSKSPGLDYGFQWDLPVPIQGTKTYFSGTNGKQKPYNLLLPQIWASKGINNKNKLFLAINLNQQYFIHNKQLSSVMMFMAPRDTGVDKVSLYKISGFGGTIAWNYKINDHWAASLGINYMLNRTALLDNQSTNIYTGNVISDSLYGINRHSNDWNYINKSMLAAHVQLFYVFNKLSLGASASLPLHSISFFDGTKIRQLNAQLFVRWNIKK